MVNGLTAESDRFVVGNLSLLNGVVDHSPRSSLIERQGEVLS